MKPWALAMLCSSSSSVLFFLLILCFFFSSFCFLSPTLCMALFTVLEITSLPQSSWREHPFSVYYCCTLLASSLSWGVFLFSFWWGYWGGGRMGGQGQGSGFVFLCFIEVRGWQGLWNVTQSCWNAAQKQMCNKLAKGEGAALGWLIPRAQYPTPGTGGELKDHIATTGTIHTHLTFDFSPFPFTKLFSLSCLLRKKLLHWGTCLKVGWGSRGRLGRV